MERMPASKYLGVRGLPAIGMKLLGRDSEVPMPIGLERDGQSILKCYSPPHFPSMRAAVEAVVQHKFGPKGVFRGGEGPQPWKDPGTVKKVNELSDRAIAATTAYCEYVWSRYGRFPRSCRRSELCSAFRQAISISSSTRSSIQPERSANLSAHRTRLFQQIE
jgi:hypothetical protein